MCDWALITHLNIAELKRNVETPVLILLGESLFTFEFTMQFNEELVDFLIVGNKADLCDQRMISYEQGYEYASTVGALFCETSAIMDKGKWK